MEKTIIPDYQKLKYPFLDSISDNRLYSLEQIVEMLRVRFNLTMEDLKQKVPTGNQSLFRYQVGSACTHLVQSGLIISPTKNVYQITNTGKQQLLVERINNLDSESVPASEILSVLESTEKQEDTDDLFLHESPEILIAKASIKLYQTLKKDLLALIEKKPLSFFQHFITDLLQKLDYKSLDNQFVTSNQQDNLGIEGIIYKDELLLDKIYIQAKKWSVEVNSKDIRNFISAMLYKGTNKGVFITTSTFSEEAKNHVAQNTNYSIVLIDVERLMQLSMKYNVGVKVKQTIEIKGINQSFLD